MADYGMDGLDSTLGRNNSLHFQSRYAKEHNRLKSKVPEAQN
jgi:hypothetical protein